MNSNSTRYARLARGCGLIVLLILLASCGQTSGGHVAQGPKGCQKIGILLPSDTTSAHWETKDHPLLVQAIHKALPLSDIRVDNANGDAAVQLSQAQADLAAQYCILVVASADSNKASAIVQAAKVKNVPVIAYDRMIQDKDLSFYVAASGIAVGEAQGQYILDHYQKYVHAGHANIMFINGAATDTNALLFKQGVHEKLDPLLQSGALHSVYEVFTPNWDIPSAQAEVGAVLAQTHGDIQIIYVANDGMASGVITTLKQYGLAGKVLVTGLDATVAGIQQILLGNQNMTVYKPIASEAQATAQLILALNKGVTAQTIATQAIMTSSGQSIPAVLLPVVTVDKTNIAVTVINSGYISKVEICEGLPRNTSSLCN